MSSNLSEELADKILAKGKPRLAELNHHGTALNILRAPMSQYELIEILDWIWASGFAAGNVRTGVASKP